MELGKIILLLILIMPPVLLISVFFIRLAYALQATPFDKRNVTQVDARMYVNRRIKHQVMQLYIHTIKKNMIYFQNRKRSVSMIKSAEK